MLRMSADAFLLAPFDFEPEAVGAFGDYCGGFSQPPSILLCGKFEAIASNLLGSFILLLMGYASFPTSPPLGVGAERLPGIGGVPQILRAHIGK